jgi:hypothetical protein
MTSTPAPTQNTPETDLATRLGIPPGRLRDWRKTGTLIEGQHWQRDGKLHVLTPAGVEHVLIMIKLDPETSLEEDPEQTPTASVRLKVARNQGQNPRLLRCLIIDPVEGIGPRVAVRLITPRVATRHFRPGTEIDVVPTETPDIFEYHGPKPHQQRI